MLQIFSPVCHLFFDFIIVFLGEYNKISGYIISDMNWYLAFALSIHQEK